MKIHCYSLLSISFYSSRHCILISFLIFITASYSSLSAQIYINGTVPTGIQTKTGVTAPGTDTWSELQGNGANPTVFNTILGINGNAVSNVSVADDFTVPAGQTWNISKFTFYAYETGYAGTVSPVNTVRLQIHDGNPALGPTNIVFGDLATNRFLTGFNHNTLRIGNSLMSAQSVVTTRRVWAVEATATVSLGPGTYWVEYQTMTSTSSAHFLPLATILNSRGPANANAIQHLPNGTWQPINDDGLLPGFIPANSPVPQALPFRINYTLCFGFTNAGSTLSTINPVCPGFSFVLSTQNTPGGSTTHQWQSSPDGVLFTNISGATGASLTTSQNVATVYRRISTCGPNVTVSSPLQVSMQTGVCYCAASALGGPENISRVQLNTIDNFSTSASMYEDFTHISTNLQTGQTYPLTINIAQPIGTSNIAAVWIDYNQNGLLTDPGEKVFESGFGKGPYSTNLIVPASALPGSTRMRIRLSFGSANLQPCGNTGFGQVEDYTVVIESGCILPILGSTVQHVSCNGGNNGSIDLSITGADNPPINWSNGATTEDISNLVAGSYTVTVGETGCATTETFVVQEPSAPLQSIESHGDILCSGGSATVNVQATGGTPPYTGTGLFQQSAGTKVYPVVDFNGCTSSVTVTLAEPAPLSCSITVSPEVTVANHAVHTIYLGYGPQSVTITGGAMGGTGQYSYSWSNGNTGASITVSPTETTVYQLTIADENSCTTTCEIEINVIDVRCGANREKVLVCHQQQGINETVGICVGYQSVAAHLLHGDMLGDCGTGKGIASRMENLITGISISPIPNPSNNYFEINIPVTEPRIYKIRIIDFYGRVIQTFETAERKIRVGQNLIPGIYYAEFIRGDEKQVVKLIKL